MEKPAAQTKYTFCRYCEACCGLKVTVENDTAEVTTTVATVTIRVKTTEDLMPGTVAFPHGWGHKNADGLTIASQHPGTNVNHLIADGPEGCEPLAGMSHMTGVLVDIRKAKKK